MTSDNPTPAAKDFRRTEFVHGGDAPVLAIVIPCYNEEAVLPISVPVLLQLLDRLRESGMASPQSYLLMSNDGSRDRTWEIIEEMHRADNRVKGISLAHNRGQQNALLAGLMAARETCDVAVTIDVDLQDPPEKIVDMMQLYLEGKDIVYGVRSDRSSDTWFKRNSAHCFYRVQKSLGLETIYDHSEFRLMSLRALDLLSEYPEKNLFLRGIFPHIGLDSAIVTYPRTERLAGETKYPFSKMLAFSIDGITSFTAQPMRLIFFVGCVLLLADIFVAIWVLVSYFSGHSIWGWSSLMLSIWFLGSLILIALGIIGEYVGKIFNEVKNRPRYAIKDKLI